MFYRGKYADPGEPREMGFKRQRLLDQGLSSCYASGPGYMYSQHHPPLVPPSAPVPPYGPLPFPAVRLRGLPFDCVESEVVDFLHGLDVVDILFVRRHGKPTGEAYCLLGYPIQVDFALTRNRHKIGRRYVEVFHCRRDEYYRAIANEMSEVVARSGSPRRGARPLAGSVVEGERERERERERGDLTEFKGMVRMRGLPYSATREDVASFFEGFGLKEGRIHLLGNGEGRPAGEAIVEFGSAEESREAVVAKDRRTLGSRYIELFPASHEDLEEAASRGRLLPKSFDGKDQTKPTPIVRMRGLPYSAGKDDIMDFFKNFTLADDSVHIVFNFDGRPTGEAFVEFSSVDDAKEALAKDRMTLGNRYVELFQSSPDDLKEALSRGR